MYEASLEQHGKDARTANRNKRRHYIIAPHKRFILFTSFFILIHDKRMKKFLLVCYLLLGKKSVALPGNADNNMQAWKAKFQKASSIPEKAELWMELGLLYRDQGSDKEHCLQNALDAFQQAIHLYGDAMNREKDALNDYFLLAGLYFLSGLTCSDLWCATLEDKYISPMQSAWEQSKQLYHSLMTKEDPMMSFRYAVVCIQQGIFMKNCGKDPEKAWGLFQEGLEQHIEPVWEKLCAAAEEDAYQILQQQRINAWLHAHQAAAKLSKYEDALQALQHV